MTTVFFVRHARSVYNDTGKMAGRHDPPLSDAGSLEAQATAAHLAGARWDAGYSSPLRRALDTARIVIGTRPMKIVVEPAIAELDMGDFSGRSWDDVLREYLPDGKVQVTFWSLFARDKIPGQESYRTAASRVMSFFDRLADEHQDQSVLVVGHKGVLEVFLAETIGYDPCTDWFEISGASVSTFDLVKGQKTRFRSINVRSGRELP